MTKFKQVSVDEFRRFIHDYPNELVCDVSGIGEPPLVSYNDFTTGLKWLESMIAKYHDENLLGGRNRYWIKQ